MTVIRTPCGYASRSARTTSTGAPTRAAQCKARCPPLLVACAPCGYASRSARTTSTGARRSVATCKASSPEEFLSLALAGPSDPLTSLTSSSHRRASASLTASGRSAMSRPCFRPPPRDATPPRALTRSAAPPVSHTLSREELAHPHGRRRLLAPRAPPPPPVRPRRGRGTKPACAGQTDRQAATTGGHSSTVVLRRPPRSRADLRRAAVTNSLSAAVLPLRRRPPSVRLTGGRTQRQSGSQEPRAAYVELPPTANEPSDAALGGVSLTGRHT